MAEVRRTKASRWRDPRLAGGILLVAISAVAGGHLVRGPEMVPVYRASGTVMPGTVISEAELSVAEVPSDVAVAYLGPNDGKDEERITAVLAPGEFVPVGSLAQERTDGNVLVVPLLSAAPGTLAKGSHAQVWRVRQGQPAGVESSAELVADDVLIVAVDTPEMMMDQSTAEIRVRDDQISPILAVLGSQDGIVLVEGALP